MKNLPQEFWIHVINSIVTREKQDFTNGCFLQDPPRWLLKICQMWHLIISERERKKKLPRYKMCWSAGNMDPSTNNHMSTPLFPLNFLFFSLTPHECTHIYAPFSILGFTSGDVARVTRWFSREAYARLLPSPVCGKCDLPVSPPLSAPEPPPLLNSTATFQRHAGDRRYARIDSRVVSPEEAARLLIPINNPISCKWLTESIIIRLYLLSLSQRIWIFLHPRRSNQRSPI